MTVPRPIIDPRLLPSLGNRFNKLCSFYVRAGRGATGGVSREPTPVEDLQAIPCRVGRMGGSERRRREGDTATRTMAILLDGHYPSIRTDMLAKVGLVYYNILAVIIDGEDVITEVQVEVVTP